MTGGRPDRPKPKRTGGVAADGTWTPEFPGQRPPMRKGEAGPNLRHGGFGVVSLGGRVAEIVAELEPMVPGFQPADRVVLGLLGLALARVEKMAAYLADAEEGTGDNLHRIREELRAQASQARRLCADLALSPRSRAAMAADLGQAGGDQLRRHLADRYGVVAGG